MIPGEACHSRLVNTGVNHFLLPNSDKQGVCCLLGMLSVSHNASGKVVVANMFQHVANKRIRGYSVLIIIVITIIIIRLLLHYLYIIVPI